MILDEIKNINSDNISLKRFGLLIGSALFLAGVLMWWKEIEQYNILGFAGIVLIALGLAIPIVLLPLHKIWMAFAVIMSWIMSRVILLILYYLILSPIAIVLRLLGKKFLDLTGDSRATTYWNSRQDKEFNKEEYEQQF